MRPFVLWLLVCSLPLVLPACDTSAMLDGGIMDTGRADGGIDGGRDAGPGDSGVDARDAREPTPDVVLPSDAPVDTNADGGGTDAGMDAGGMDAGTDGGMADTGVDTGVDAGMTDTGVDAGVDAGTRCAVEADCSRDLVCLPSLTCGCSPRLDPLDGPSGRSEPLQISEIVPGPGGYIELYNHTDAPIDLATTGYQFCAPFAYAALTGAVVPARGYAMVPFPVSFADTLAGGEVILYRNGLFGTPASVMDFVCWGVNPHATRMSTAVSAMKWSGGCAPAITGGAIHRRIGTDGTSLSSYDVTSPPSGAACSP